MIRHPLSALLCLAAPLAFAAPAATPIEGPNAALEGEQDVSSLLRAERDMTARMRAHMGAQAGRMAIPIPDLDGTDDCRGLDTVADRLAKARLIGFGESTHGTAEFNRLRFGIFKRLVARHGVTHFLLEDMLWATAPLEDFIQGRTAGGTPAAALSRLMWPWCTRDMAGFLVWARDYNARQPDPSKRVHIIGVDIQKPYRQAGHLAELLRQGGQPQKAIEALERILEGMPKADPLNFPELVIQQNDPATPGRWRRADAELAGWDQPMASVMTPTEASLLAAIHCGIALESIQGGIAMRDQGMALQALAVLKRLPAGAKAVFWAHSGHVYHPALEKGYPSAGGLLRDRLGEGYAVLGCLTQQGWATTKDIRLLGGAENADGTFKPGTPDIKPQAMAFRTPDAFLETILAKGITQGVLFMSDWLQDPVTQDFFADRTLECSGMGATFDPAWSVDDRMPFRAADFDAVFFTATTSASENLRFPATAAGSNKH